MVDTVRTESDRLEKESTDPHSGPNKSLKHKSSFSRVASAEGAENTVAPDTRQITAKCIGRDLVSLKHCVVFKKIRHKLQLFHTSSTESSRAATLPAARNCRNEFVEIFMSKDITSQYFLARSYDIARFSRRRRG